MYNATDIGLHWHTAMCVWIRHPKWVWGVNRVICLYWVLLAFCNCSLVVVLCQLFGTDSQKTCVTLLIVLSCLLITLLLGSHSSLLFSTHVWRPNSSGYHILILLVCHHMSTIITNCMIASVAPHSLSWAWPSQFDLAPKWNKKPGYCKLYVIYRQWSPQHGFCGQGRNYHRCSRCKAPGPTTSRGPLRQLN